MNQKIILEFKKQYSFLSNFHPCDVEFEGKIYPSTEHAYQAAKTLNNDEREIIRTVSTAKEAKKMGKVVSLRPDWEEVKLDVMLNLCRKKFKGSEELKQKLLDTGGAVLQEGNWWGDRFWGIDIKTGIGENHLGKILMKIRDEIKWPKKERRLNNVL